jgi:hypothetical protein
VISDSDPPDEEYWEEVASGRRIHPYGMFRKVNRDDVEIVNSISDENDAPRRWVIVVDGRYEAWVRVANWDEYGYEIRPGEHVSEAEREAIELKQAAMGIDPDVTVAEARELVESDDPEQIRHGLVALLHAATADPDVPDEDVDEIRKLVHEHTGYVDTSHVPTVMDVIRDADSLAT